MTIEYEINEIDYVNFNLYHIQNSPSQKKLFNLIRFALPVPFMPVVYFTGTLLLQQPEMFWAFMALFFYCFWVFIYPKEHKRTIKKQSAKLLNEGDNTSFFGKKRLDIIDGKLIMEEENATSTLSKEKITSIKEYDDMFVLYLSAVSAHIVPKRCLTEENMISIRTLLN